MENWEEGFHEADRETADFFHSNSVAGALVNGHTCLWGRHEMQSSQCILEEKGTWNLTNMQQSQAQMGKSIF